MKFLLHFSICLAAFIHVLPGESREDSPGHAISKFDNSLAEIDKLILATNEDGEFFCLLNKAFAKNKNLHAQTLAKANDTTLATIQRASYEYFLNKIEIEMNNIADKKSILVRMNCDLKKQHRDILKNKQFYIDMLELRNP